MRVVIVGGHGQIARRLGRLLAQRGDQVVAIVRQPGHLADVERDGATGVLLDLERASVADLAQALTMADAVVFAAGAGPGSGIPRKDTVDRAAAVLTADAAQLAEVRRLVQISSMGTDRVRGEGVTIGADDVFGAYLRAKAAAEDDLRGRADLDWTILRPGGLTDDPGTGRVALAPHVERGTVPRDDVAAVVVAMLDGEATIGRVLELTSGPAPIDEAIAGLSGIETDEEH